MFNYSGPHLLVSLSLLFLQLQLLAARDLRCHSSFVRGVAQKIELSPCLVHVVLCVVGK